MVRSRQRGLILLIGCTTVFWLLLHVGYPNYAYPHREYFSQLFNKIHLTDEGTNSSLSSRVAGSWDNGGSSLETRQLLFPYTMKATDTRNFSILGKWLRAPEGTKPPPSNRDPALGRYKILMWKHGVFLHQRHVLHYDSNSSGTFSPWTGCSVECDLSYRDRDLASADAVIFHMHKTKERRDIPPVKGKAGQIWIFLTDESPLHTFMFPAKNGNVSQYDDTFDWSMMYREDSDVPVPYGRTIERNRDVNAEKTDEEDRQGRRKIKTKLVAIMGSHCHSTNNKRWKYAGELKALLNDKMDVYGECLGGNRTACPGHFRRDCPLIVNYKFYLAFENCNCREYMTEKVFWNAYEKGSVPIIMGAPPTDCQRLLPPRSYLHVDDFASPRSLAEHILYLDKHDDAYDEYHRWRSRYKVINEHGYFGSRSIHYCRVCEALHYNARPPPIPKYRRLRDFLNPREDCDPYAKL